MKIPKLPVHVNEGCPISKLPTVESSMQFADLSLQARICFVLFAASPMWILLFSGSPESFVLSMLGVADLVTVATYFIFPLLICSTIWLRSWFLVPLFLIQCFLLVVHSALNPTLLESETQSVRWISISLATVMGFLLLNRDFLYPLIRKNRRRWRVAPRFAANAQLEVYNGEQLIAVASMVDYSRAGVGLLVPKETSEQDLRPAHPNSHIAIKYQDEKDRFEVPVRLIWSQEQAGHLRVGMQSLNVQAMEQLSNALTGTVNPTSVPNHNTNRLKKYARRLGFAIWIASLALAFGLPAFT